MTLTDDRALVLSLLIASFVAIYLRGRADKAHIAELQEKATRAFREYKVASNESKFAFVGSEATISRREETGGGRGIFEKTATLDVAIYAFNAHGEFFLFKWHSKTAKPYFKHLPHGQKDADNTSNGRKVASGA